MKTIVINDTPGSLKKATSYLSKNKINLRFLAAHRISHGKSGIAYLLPAKGGQNDQIAKMSPRQGVIQTNDQPAFFVQIRDTIGSLDKVLEPLAGAKIDVFLCVAISVSRGRAIALIALSTRKDLEKAKELLRKKKIKVFPDLRGLLG